MLCCQSTATLRCHQGLNCPPLRNKKPVLSKGEPHDATVNFDTNRYGKRRRGRVWRQSQHKHLESRLEVIQGRAFCYHCKADEGLRISV